MATIIPKSELVRLALVYIEEKRIDSPDCSLTMLLDEAGMRFNLTPLDAECLERMLRSSPNGHSTCGKD